MEIPRHWRLRKQRYSMQGGICPGCETKMFPAREICPNCGYGSQGPIELNDSEALYSRAVAIPAHAFSA